MKTSPTQRSLKYLRDCGWTVCIVEKYIAAIRQRKDAFGFGDLLACRTSRRHPSRGQIALIQTTTGAHMADRKGKILNLPEFQKWKDAGGIVLLHGWRKIGPRGERKTWQVAEETL